MWSTSSYLNQQVRQTYARSDVKFHDKIDFESTSLFLNFMFNRVKTVLYIFTNMKNNSTKKTPAPLFKIIFRVPGKRDTQSESESHITASYDSKTGLIQKNFNYQHLTQHSHLQWV